MASRKSGKPKPNSKKPNILADEKESETLSATKYSMAKSDRKVDKSLKTGWVEGVDSKDTPNGISWSKNDHNIVSPEAAKGAEQDGRPARTQQPGSIGGGDNSMEQGTSAKDSHQPPHGKEGTALSSKTTL